tara:strand:+ start:1781 stop:2380 length:600 start_codon:yes stop_codon:yes gene_type:complete
MKVIEIPTNINIKKLSKQVLKNEPKVIKKHPAKTIDFKSNFDGQTGLGYNSLTSRSCHFNVLNWWNKRSLKEYIRHGYEMYTGIKGKSLYVQCWANVMRKGEQIKSHSHSFQDNLNVPEYLHLCGHLCVQVDGTTSTYYEGSKILNKNGTIVLFPSWAKHWTDVYEGDGERITVAFDIYNQELYDVGVIDIAKSHWVRI